MKNSCSTGVFPYIHLLVHFPRFTLLSLSLSLFFSLSSPCPLFVSQRGFCPSTPLLWKMTLLRVIPTVKFILEQERRHVLTCTDMQSWRIHTYNLTSSRTYMLAFHSGYILSYLSWILANIIGLTFVLHYTNLSSQMHSGTPYENSSFIWQGARKVSDQKLFSQPWLVDYCCGFYNQGFYSWKFAAGFFFPLWHLCFQSQSHPLKFRQTDPFVVQSRQVSTTPWMARVSASFAVVFDHAHDILWSANCTAAYHVLIYSAGATHLASTENEAKKETKNHQHL